jgi:hypothetical protein
MHSLAINQPDYKAFEAQRARRYGYFQKDCLDQGAAARVMSYVSSIAAASFWLIDFNLR